MRKIGCFKKENHIYRGSIDTLYMHVEVIIKPIKAHSSTDPAYIVVEDSGSRFANELGVAYNRNYCTGEATIPYLAVAIDDPSCPRPIHAVLWHDPDDGLYYLFWDRHVAGHQGAEKLYAQSELLPPIGSARAPAKITPYIQDILALS